MHSFSSSSQHPRRPITQTMWKNVLIVLALLSSATAIPRTQQVPFEAEATAAIASGSPEPPSSSASLHRLCLPPSKAEVHWPAILSSLYALEATHPSNPLDIWSQPRLVRADAEEGSEETAEESSCIDLTYSDTATLDELVHAADRGAELDWTILADEDELARRVDAQKQSSVEMSAVGDQDAFHASYHRLINITAFLSYQVAQHPNLAELVDFGTTYEQRVIQGIRLGSVHPQDGHGDDDDHVHRRKQIVIVAGAHGREWITTSTALYLVSAFLAHPSWLKTFSVVIVPVLNPDGFEYTWTTDRFFRKNRQLASGHDWWGRKCYGVDVSRNFPINFRRPSFGSNPCSPTYAGEEPLASAEAQALSSYLSGNHTHGIISFIDLHSYGQLVLHPWLSCSSEAGEVPDEEDLSEVAIGASRAAKGVHGKSYRVGRGCEAMYNQDGSAVDYAYHHHEAGGAGIKYSFEFELRDEGSYGFTLPADQIRPTAEEVWSGLQYLLKFVKAREKL